MSFASSLVAVSVFLLSLVGGAEVRADELQPGMPAPDFALPGHDGSVHRLADYRGRWLVLYFYPRDDTPGCTEQACRFRDDVAHFRSMGAQVVGISVDSVDSHMQFAEKHGLPFPLLADEGGDTAKAYGSLRNWGLIKIAHRHTFIIDPEGRIARIYRKVDTATHSADVIAELTRLQAAAASS